MIPEIPFTICSPIYCLEGHVNSKEKYLVLQDAGSLSLVCSGDEDAALGAHL